MTSQAPNGTPQALVFGSSIADDLKVLRLVLAPLAERTDTQIDDAVVQVIDSILASPALIALVDGLLNGRRGDEQVQVEQLNVAGIAELLKYLPMIVSLIKTLRELGAAK